VRTLLLLGALASAVVVAAACGPATPSPTNPNPIGTGVLDASAPPVAVDAAAPPVDTGAADAAAAPPSAADAGTTSAPAGDAGATVAVFVPTSCVSKTVSLSKDIQPIMQHCGSIEGCHGFKVRTPAGTYKFLVGAKSTQCDDGRLLASPSDPEHSYVIDKLTNRHLCKGDPMPRTLRSHDWTELPQADIQAMYDWICEGAPNN
jgi:hypothetical protein